MDATATFVADVTVALLAGSVAGALARLARVTPVIGYIVAGIIIGPFTPGYTAHGSNLSGLAELGLIFLLFSLGLEFSVGELAAAGVAAALGNAVAMTLIAAAVWLTTHSLGLPHPVTLALAFTVSSTAVGVALLQILGLLGKRSGHVTVSVLIMQDLIAVMILIVISAPAASLSIAGVGIPLLKAVLFVAIALLLGATVFHRLFLLTLHRAGADLLVVIFSAVALAAAWLGHLAGLTFEFGAFVAGAVTSEAAGRRMVQSIVRPFRELFVMLFFVSIGTLVDVDGIRLNWRALVVIAIVTVLVRWLLWTGVSRLLRFTAGTAAALGVALVPMGEFNIVLGNASFAAGRLNRTEIALLIGSAMISIFVSAIGARAGERWFSRKGAPSSPTPDVSIGAPVVVVGFGRVGRTAASMLVEHGLDVAVVEHDAALVRSAQEAGLEAIYGDGGDPHVLEHVISPRTRVVLTSVPDSAANAAIAQWLRARNVPAVIARAERSADIRRLLEAGAQAALVPEVEGARAFGRAVLEAIRKDDVSPEPQE